MPSRYLTSVNSSSSSAVAEPPTSINVDSDFIVIIAALFCALICVVGLAAVARCAWLRRAAGGAAGTGMSQPQAASANKGLKKKILRKLPKLTFNTDVNGKLADCPICLTEFVDGDEIRVLPQCGHTFHVGCIDTWLGSHSSCPSCRQILVVGMCHKCGGLPATSASTVDPEAGLKAREDDVNRFLP